MPSYYAKDSLVQNQQLKVQRLVIPFKIAHNASSASVVISANQPALLFLNTQGVNQISAVAAGSPSFASPNDAAGTFNALVQINEPVLMVCHAEVISRTGAVQAVASLANTSGLTSNGLQIVLNATTGVNASTTDFDACLVMEYIIEISCRSVNTGSSVKHDL